MQRVVLADVPPEQKLGCRKWGCNKWGLKGCLAALPGNRPKSAKIALFLPFSPFSGGCQEHLANPENGAFFLRYPRISLNPHLLNPHLRHSKKTGTRVHSDVHPERKPERGYVRMFPRNETGTRAHSPKPPFYETALLSPTKLGEEKCKVHSFSGVLAFL